MIKKGKYVITPLSPFLFNENIPHTEVSTFAYSAGFFYLSKNSESEGGFDVICYSESESLNVVSNPEKDAMKIKELLLNKNQNN